MAIDVDSYDRALKLAAAPGVEDALDRNSWTDSYLVGEECEAFLDEEIARTEDIVEGLGR